MTKNYNFPAEVGELLSCAKIPFFEKTKVRRSNTQGVEYGEEVTFCNLQKRFYAEKCVKKIRVLR